MTEIFRLFGFVFFFYSREHEPIHIHVEGNGGRARFVFDDNDGTFSLSESTGIKSGDLKKITRVIEDNTDILIKTWNKYFKMDDENS